MTTLTLELPDTLAEQLRQQQINTKEIQAIVVVTLETWLASLGQNSTTQNRGRFAESGTLFARRLIQQNRELFETLAQR
ncbi:MAG: hypothetical protein HY741_16035 [Chloroflexi bacterium]|nr:hypothetical protein [Chloroflexota bacterium]